MVGRALVWSSGAFPLPQLISVVAGWLVVHVIAAVPASVVSAPSAVIAGLAAAGVPYRAA